MFCFANSFIPTSNDFRDFQQYFIKCTIPQAAAQIKDNSGGSRKNVKNFLLKQLKLNDNSNNEVPTIPAPQIKC